MAFPIIAQIDRDPVKISDHGPYVFMGLVATVLAGVGIYRWYQERRRKAAIERGIMNTMSRQEYRRLARQNAKSKRE